MTKRALTESHSDNSWANSPSKEFLSTPSSSSLNRKKLSPSLQEFLHPVDETPDFHDPYSNLSLFLSHQIKQEMQEIGLVQKWTIKFQEDLIQKITPEFQRKFPQYRLGVAALKKIWEKVVFYTQQIQSKSEALDANGKLNINFFIKENLRQYFQQRNTSFLHPYQLAHQIAAKMSECIAVLEGTKPKLHMLTQIIWSLQKHLLTTYPSSPAKASSQGSEKTDKLIVKTILETTAKHPYIGMEELKSHVKDSLQAMHDLPDFSSTDKVICHISSILAEKLYPTSPFHTLFLAKQKEALSLFIKKHSSLYKSAKTTSSLPELVRRITALYTLASQLPKNIDKEAFIRAVEASLDNSLPKPELDQSLYAFISAELCLLKGQDSFSSSMDISQLVFDSYLETSFLPSFSPQHRDFVEVMAWKTLSETEGFLEKLPYRIGQKIEEEIAQILIDNPLKSFSSITHETLQFFKKVKELTEQSKWQDIEEKIHIWSLQNDMLCRSIHMNLDTPLAQIIQKKWLEKGLPSSALNFVCEVSQEFLYKFPTMAFYIPQINSKIWTLYKYMWFTLFAKKNESSFTRFLKWHNHLLQSQDSSEEEVLLQLEEVCKKCLPLIPFDPKMAQALLAKE